MSKILNINPAERGYSSCTGPGNNWHTHAHTHTYTHTHLHTQKKTPLHITHIYSHTAFNVFHAQRSTAHMLTCKYTHQHKQTHVFPSTRSNPPTPTHLLLKTHENLLHQQKISIVSGWLCEPDNRIVTFNTLLVWMSISWTDRISWKNDFCIKTLVSAAPNLLCCCQLRLPETLHCIFFRSNCPLRCLAGD